MQLKAILFDMGSTLIEFENSSWEMLREKSARNSYNFLKNRNLIEFDLPLYAALIDDLFYSSFEVSSQTLEEIRFEDLARDIFKKLNLSQQDGDFTEFLQSYYLPITEQVTLIEGAAQVLAHFREKSFKLGLVSNTIFPAEFHLEELKRFRLISYFDAIFFSSEVGYKKPHPYIFRRALNQLEIDPEESIFIGDKLIEDIGGAKNMGMKAVLRFKEGRDYSAPITPDRVIKNLTELPDVIGQINARSWGSKEKS